MTRRRVLTDEQCRDLAAWHTKLKETPSMMQKCRELGVSWATLKDAIRRGSGQSTMYTERKVRDYLDEVSRGTATES